MCDYLVDTRYWRVKFSLYSSTGEVIFTEINMRNHICVFLHVMCSSMWSAPRRNNTIILNFLNIWTFQKKSIVEERLIFVSAAWQIRKFEQKSHNYSCIAPTQGTVFNDNLLIGKLNRGFVEWLVIRRQYSLCLLCNCVICVTVFTISPSCVPSSVTILTL